MSNPQPTTAGPHVAKVGRLTRDPELRFSTSGTAVATFGLAVKPWTPKGEPEAETVFYDVVSFGGLAEHVTECLVKADRVIVTGRGEIERWTSKDGVERTTKKIVADAVGPDLRFTGVGVQRADRPDPSPQQTFTDEEPF
jgi:single-strand DNA-binding protein